MNTVPSQVVGGPAGPIYVAAREVAGVCGICEHALDTRFRPDAWAAPRDFTLNGTGALLFALASLPELADALQASGATDAALLLREWVAPRLAAACGRAPCVTPPKLEETSAPPVSRLLAWENEHDA
jgi:hypothetical protein